MRKSLSDRIYDSLLKKPYLEKNLEGESMLYREMPKTKDKLSILGFGCMRLPGGQMNADEKESIDQIRYAIDQGVNYLDTAWTYHGGKSEVILEKRLRTGIGRK